MKIRNLAFLLIAATACEVSNVTENSSLEVSLFAELGENTTGKAQVVDGNFTWTAGDKISVWTTADKFQTLTLTEGANTERAKFEGVLVGDGVRLSNYAVYPAGRHSLNGEQLSVNLPSIYDLTKNIASVSMPMFARLTEETALFTQMGGLMSFTLNNVPAEATHIVLKALDKTISGVFSTDVNMAIPVLNATELSDANWIDLVIPAAASERNIKVIFPLPVGVYTGLRIEALDANNELLSFAETSKTNTVNRKSIVNMPAIDMSPKDLTNKQLYARMVAEVTTNVNKYAFDSNGNKLLTIAHSSDIHPHGVNYDRNTEECVNYCNSMNDILDALVVTGDYCNGLQGRLEWWSTSEMEDALSILDKSTVPLYTLIGNHDDNINLTTKRPAVQTGINPKNAELYYLDAKERYSWIIGPYLEKFSPEEANPEQCYYKIDFDDYKIRIIFLDAMDCPHVFEGGYLKYIPGLFFDQNQLEWLYNTLLTTPKDFGVIVTTHGPFISGFERATYAQGAQMIPSIIDAFKQGTVYEHNWTYAQDASISTSFKFDFTSHGKGDFICYLAGHIHYRRANKSYFNDQLVITAPALYQADMSEMTRKGSSLDRFRDTTTINSFNLISVDRLDRKIILTSFGAFEDETANVRNRTEILSY